MEADVVLEPPATAPVQRSARSTRRTRRVRRLRLLAVASALLILILGVSQILLPQIATERLKASLSRNGQRVHVSLSAFPAFELLFGEADKVHVTIGRLRSGKGHVGSLLARAEGAGELDARVGELDTHGLVLTNVTLLKRGRTLTASGTVTRAAVQAALPLHLVLAPAPAGSTGVIARGHISVFGHDFNATAALQAQSGRIVLRLLSPALLARLNPFRITLFGSSIIWVDRVTAVSRGDGYILSASAHYR